MTESQFTRQLLRYLRGRMPNAMIFKHAEQFTTGIPDFSVTRAGLTTWFEVKVILRPRGNIVAQLGPAQWETLRRLERGYLVLNFSTSNEHRLVHVPIALPLTEDTRDVVQAEMLSAPRLTYLNLIEKIVQTCKET